MNNVPPSPLVEEKLEIYITDNDTLKIGFGAINMDVGPAEGNVDDTEDLEDRRWRMFNNLCLKTFKQANCLLYEDENIDENDEPESSFSDITEDSVPSGSTSGPSNSTGSQPRPTGEPFTSVKPRRELVWRVPPERSATVSSVARHYRGYLERARLRNAKYLPLRQLRARIGGQSRVRHRCLGYRKEEITLTASIEESAIVSHATPSLREICLVCNEVVDVGIFECICGLEDDGVSVTVKCSICSTYSHEACVDLQGTHNVFICHLCPRRKSLYPREAGMPKAIRAKSGCYTCKIRRKKCDRWVDEYGRCETCVRLRLQCLGAGDKRSEWLRDNTQELRDKIRNFLVSQGMIRDHSGSGSRALRQDQTLQFSDSQYNVYI
ncbi:hypothetical protein VKT23_016274 [Stygiomarasmius scandens]|uniref:Zn(2)-C6 fungal-type domain-containing protein n=1 Tax=Marasmiellus scandens TaxID=2682957 RepID=A0ABR1IYH6_9AGAR